MKRPQQKARAGRITGCDGCLHARDTPETDWREAYPVVITFCPTCDGRDEWRLERS